MIYVFLEVSGANDGSRTRILWLEARDLSRWTTFACLRSQVKDIARAVSLFLAVVGLARAVDSAHVVAVPTPAACLPASRPETARLFGG